MYIYDVEYVRGGQGGALTLEIGQNRGFGRGLAQPSSPHSLTWWVKWLNPFAYHLATLGEQFQSKEPLSNVYWGGLGANNHQKKARKWDFSWISRVNAPPTHLYMYIYIYNIYFIYIIYIYIIYNYKQVSRTSLKKEQNDNLKISTFEVLLTMSAKWQFALFSQKPSWLFLVILFR